MFTTAFPVRVTAPFAAATNDRPSGSRRSSDVWPKNTRRGDALPWRPRCLVPAAFFTRTPTWCRHRAGELGPAVTELVEVLLTEPVLHRLRAAQGVLRLAERYPLARLDAACARAIKVGDPSYRAGPTSLVPAVPQPGRRRVHHPTG